jgi:cytochrome c peroxidase
MITLAFLTMWVNFILLALMIEIPLGLDAFLPTPEDNPLTPEKVALGRELFFDKRLSRDQTVACATCHDSKLAFTDRRPVAVGVFERRGTRRVPTIVNRAWGRSFFWDGRVATLEEQVLKPIQAPEEMDLTVAEAAARVGRSRGEISQALASYVRTILAGGSRYDKYVAGDREALTAIEREGLQVFRGKANCTACHIGPNLSDERFHNTGVAWRDGRLSDPGREDRGAFKTPTLREVAGRPPYMHDGSLATLADVIEFYNRGGNRNPNLDPEIRPLGLTEGEKRALAAFLGSLSGEVREGL